MKCEIEFIKITNFLETLKLVRTITGWDLAECKAFLDTAQKPSPQYQFFNAPRYYASNDIIQAFKQIGTSVFIRNPVDIKKDVCSRDVVITDLRERIISKTMQVGHITSGTFFFGKIGEYNSLFVKCGGQIMHAGTGNIMPESLVFVNNYIPVRVEILIKEEITNKP